MESQAALQVVKEYERLRAVIHVAETEIDRLRTRILSEILGERRELLVHAESGTESFHLLRRVEDRRRYEPAALKDIYRRVRAPGAAWIADPKYAPRLIAQSSITREDLESIRTLGAICTSLVVRRFGDATTRLSDVRVA